MGFGESCTISHHSTSELFKKGVEPRRWMMVQLTKVPSFNQRTGLTGPEAGTDMKDGNRRVSDLNETKINK